MISLRYDGLVYTSRLSINQSIYFAIKGHRPLTNHMATSAYEIILNTVPNTEVI